MTKKLQKFSLIALQLASTGKLWLIMLFLFAGSFSAYSQLVLPYGYTWTKSSTMAGGWCLYTFTYNTDRNDTSYPYPPFIFAANSYGWDISNGSAYIRSITVNNFPQGFTTTKSGTYFITAKLDVPEFANWGTAIRVEVYAQNSFTLSSTIEFGASNGPNGWYLEKTPPLANLNYYPPGQPYSLNSNSITSNSFCASWAQGFSDATQPPPTSYKYWVTNAGGGTVVGVTDNGGSTGVCVNGLAPNTSYNFNVVGVNSVGDGYTSTKIITTANQFPQSITFNPNPLQDKTYGDADFTLSASASSGLGVTFSSSNSAIATVSGNTVHIVKAGTVNIYADQAGNATYYPAPRVSRSLTINPKELTVNVTGATANNKVYDGNTGSTYSGALPVGIVGSDVVTLVQSGTFADKNVANNIAIVPAMTLTGTNAANYTLTQPVIVASANITPKELTVSNAVAGNKTYDINTDAVITGATLVGKVGSDDVVLATATAGTFANQNVANGINVIPAMTISGTAIGNYTLTQPTLSANITAKELTVTGALASNKIYDSTIDAEISEAILIGVLNSEDVVLATAIAGTFASPNVAEEINVIPAMTITGAGIANYSITQPTLSANITQKEITVTGEVADNKIYDSNTNASFTGASLIGVFPSDVANVNLSAFGQFAEANIGTGIIVTPGMLISGTKSANYSLTQPANTIANITAKELTVSGAVASNKIYDGNTDAVITGAALVGKVGSEDVVLSTKTAGAFVSPIVANGISVTPTMTITGEAIGNYTLTQPTLSANITQKELTVTGSVANNKIYDSTTDATFSEATLVGIVGSDDVIIEPNGVFDDANVNIGINVTPIMTITGSKSGNYTITQPETNFSADITKKELTVNGALAANKVYDTNTDAVISGATLAGVIGTEDVTLTTNTAGVFADFNVANGIIVTSSMSIIGDAISNYTITQPILSANITAAPLSISTVTAANKVYNATTVAALSGGSLVGVLGSDVVTIVLGTGAFANKTIGNVKSVTASRYQITGTEAHNYMLIAQPVVTSANITAAPLTIVGVKAANKVYDATKVAALSGGSLVVIQGSDDVSIIAGSGSFANKTIGTGKPVTAIAYALSGADAGNYQLIAQPIVTSANITSAPLTIEGVTAANKVYDANTVAALSGGSLVVIQGTDDVSIIAGSGTFSDKNKETGKTVTAIAYALSGADAANYQLMAQPIVSSANITAAILGITADSKSRVYGSENPEFTITYSGFIGSETIQNITIPQISCLANSTSIVGEYTVSLSGGSAENYTFILENGVLNVTKAILKVTAENKSRLFSKINPELTWTYEGFVINETASDLLQLPLAETSASTTSLPGDYTITVSGGLSKNYSFDFVNGILTIDAFAGDKNRDGIITAPEIAGDVNGDGKITAPEITGDTNGDGIIGDDEIAGDGDGDGKITSPEIAGDTNGDGTITSPEIAGDTNGDGKIEDGEITGDTNGDGIIGDSEITGDTNGDGIIDDGEIAGDTNGDGIIGDGEITGDINGDGIIGDGEITGDTSGDGIIADEEVAGDTNGDGNIDAGGIAGDRNGDGIIGDGEIAGDLDGNGTITAPEIAGDVNGDGTITAPEITGDINGDGIIGNGEISGDGDGNGTITAPEIAGDTNGDGIIGDGEIIGDTNGDGIIGNDEIAGDLDGNGTITATEIAGDKNGDGIICDSEITGDIDGDGIIGDGEITGDTSGDGIIADEEVAGDTNGDGNIDEGGIAGDTNGNGIIDDVEIAGDLDGNGTITAPEIAGDTDGDGIITAPEIAGDINGDNKIEGTELAGDTNGDAYIGNGEVAGDVNGDGISGENEDMDGDGISNAIDNCPTTPNLDQADIDRNGIGDICDDGGLETPKGFSPNGDGINDEFIIAGLQNYPNNSIEVYNRYGNKVYESKNYQNYWDGVSTGKTQKLPAAPYYYVLSINGGSKILKGWVYINY